MPFYRLEHQRVLVSTGDGVGSWNQSPMDNTGQPEFLGSRVIQAFFTVAGGQ